MSTLIAKTNHDTVCEAIDGLRALRAAGSLSLTARAALEALERLHARVRWNRFAVLTEDEIRGPLASARRALQIVH